MFLENSHVYVGNKHSIATSNAHIKEIYYIIIYVNAIIVKYYLSLSDIYTDHVTCSRVRCNCRKLRDLHDKH